MAAQVPWARHGAGHTYAFDDTAAWLVTHCSKSAVRDLLRIAWRTVGSIVTRVVADAEANTDRFANLTRIGIDEIYYKRGHKYLTVVVDHDSGVLLWAHPGRDQKTLEKFFDRLREEGCAQITLVSADAAEWIANVVADRCTNAELCLDPFHIVAWATKALDEVRREVWNAARKGGQKTAAKDLKNARFALLGGPAPRRALGFGRSLRSRPTFTTTRRSATPTSTASRKGIKDGKARDQVFPRLNKVGAAVTGEGLTVEVRFVKAGEMPVRFITDGENLDAAAVRDVDLLKKYHGAPADLAAKLKITQPGQGSSRASRDRRRRRMPARVRLRSTEICGYSDNAFTKMRDALKEVDIDAVWATHGKVRTRRPLPPCSEKGCVGQPATGSVLAA